MENVLCPWRKHKSLLSLSAAQHAWSNSFLPGRLQHIKCFNALARQFKWERKGRFYRSMASEQKKGQQQTHEPTPLWTGQDRNLRTTCAWQDIRQLRDFRAGRTPAGSVSWQLKRGSSTNIQPDRQGAAQGGWAESQKNVLLQWKSKKKWAGRADLNAGQVQRKE